MTYDQRLRTAAGHLRVVEQNIERLEADLALANYQRKTLERETLPELMHEAGVKSFELEDGSKITLSTLAEGSLPKDPLIRKEAIQWLCENGYENLIECVVISSWARGERAVAEAEALRLARLGNAKVTFDEGIHFKTLGARMRDRVVNGLETPLTLLGVAVFPRARFTKRPGT